MSNISRYVILSNGVIVENDHYQTIVDFLADLAIRDTREDIQAQLDAGDPIENMLR